MEIADRFTRTRFLFGEDFKLFGKVRVAIFGIGGVGGFALDSLYRVGIGHDGGEICIIDKDVFDVTNQNRQIGSDFVGEDKVATLARIYLYIEDNENAFDWAELAVNTGKCSSTSYIFSLYSDKLSDYSDYYFNPNLEKEEQLIIEVNKKYTI